MFDRSEEIAEQSTKLLLVALHRFTSHFPTMSQAFGKEASKSNTVFFPVSPRNRLEIQGLQRRCCKEHGVAFGRFLTT